MPTHSTRSLDVAAHVAASIVPAVLDVIGQSWSLAIIEALLLREKSFGQLLLELSIPRSTLSARLKHLAAMGCLEPVSNGYRLTSAGQALLPIVSLVRAWDLAERPQGNGFLHHCGNAFSPVLVCACCARPVRAKDIHLDSPGDIPPLQDLPKPARRSRAEFSTSQGLNAAELLGDRWTALIVALGFYGVQRYSDIARHLAIAPNILADRLLRLCEGRVLLRESEHETGRPVYRFSERGLQLFSLIVVLIAWGDQWLRPAQQLPTLMRHLPCDQVLKPLLRCSCCGENVTMDSLSAAPA